MSAYNSILSDQELRDLFKTALMDGEDNDALTETFIEMERKMVFTAEAAIALPLFREQELLSKLHASLGTKVAGKLALNLKWLLGGFGGLCVATGVVVYNQQQQPEIPRSSTLITNTLPDSSAAQPANNPVDTALVQTPALFTPNPVTKPTYSLEPLPPVSARTDSRMDQSLSDKEAAWGLGEPPIAYEPAPPMTYVPVEPMYCAPVPQITYDNGFEDDTLAPSDTIFRGIKRLEVNIQIGDIHIMPSPNGDLKMSGFFKQEDCETNGSTLWITSEQKKYRLLKHIGPEEHLLHFEVPAGTELVLNTASGQIHIDGMNGGSCKAETHFGDVHILNSRMNTTVSASSGMIDLMDITGNVNIDGSFGDIHLANITGTVNAHVASGEFIAEHLNGNATVTSDFGDLTIIRAAGELTVTANSGNTHLDSITAHHCTIISNFGDVELTDIIANVQLQVNSGNITLRNLQGDLHAESAFGNATIDHMNGELTLTGNSGNLIIDNHKGNMTIDSQFGNLTIHDSKGNADLTVNSGNIDVKDMDLTDQLIVSVGFGNSKIGLKNDYKDIRFELEAQMGKVKISKGDMKLEKENGIILVEQGRINVKGSASSGNMTFN